MTQNLGHGLDWAGWADLECTNSLVNADLIYATFTNTTFTLISVFQTLFEFNKGLYTLGPCYHHHKWRVEERKPCAGCVYLSKKDPIF